MKKDTSTVTQGTNTSQTYFILTHNYYITPSITRRGNCWDNAPMEISFGHLKEAFRHLKNPTIKLARQLTGNHICFYNYERYN